MPSSMYEDRGGKVVAVITACSIAVTVIIGLRFYVRFGIIKNPGVDDWALAAVLVTFVSSATILAVATKFGFGSHIYFLSLSELSLNLKFIWISTLGYSAAITLMKATVLLQYRRIFPLPHFQRYCDIFLAFVFIWALTGTLGTLLICLPIKRNWNPLEPANCGNRIYFWETYGILHVITDVFILILPLPVLKTLPLPRVEKGILIAVFCLGFFTCVISAIRLTSLRASLMDPDVTWTGPETVYLSIGEVTCAIICVCVPTLRPLVTRSNRLCRRTQEGNGAPVSRNSSEWRKYLSDGTDHLETQTTVHSLNNVDNSHLISENDPLDRIIQEPSSCHLKLCGRGPKALDNR